MGTTLGSSDGSSCILIVDDHDETLRMLNMAVQWMGYRVQTARSVAEAHACLKAGGIDLVLTDWALHDGTGGDICDAARRLHSTRPVVILSALYDEKCEEIATCEADACLTKPFDIAVLQSTLQRLLNGESATDYYGELGVAMVANSCPSTMAVD